MNYDLEKILCDKNGFKIIKRSNNQFKLTFQLENQHINISKIIDFSLIQLIYELNTDICEKISIEKKTENKANIFLLLKNLFEDLGLPQFFAYIEADKIVSEKQIIFNTKTNNTSLPNDFPKNIDFFEMKEFVLILTCDIITQHKTNILFDITFNKKTNIPDFLDKLIVLVLNKIYKRAKQFIENMTF